MPCYTVFSHKKGTVFGVSSSLAHLTRPRYVW